MTVQELIEHLQTMPGHATVIYSCCSDLQEMEKKDVEFVSAEQSRLEMERRETMPAWWKQKTAICYRGGMYREAYPLKQYPPGEQPLYRDVVVFPGN